jgi:hypothetical protein
MQGSIDKREAQVKATQTQTSELFMLSSAVTWIKIGLFMKKI